MRKRLSLTIALGVLGAVVAAGSVNAGSQSLLQQGESQVSIDLPDGGDGAGLQEAPACSNLIDDDGDGLIDLRDPGCTGALDGDEFNPPPPEDDGSGSGSGSDSGGGGDTGSGDSGGGIDAPLDLGDRGGKTGGKTKTKPKPGGKGKKGKGGKKKKGGGRDRGGDGSRGMQPPPPRRPDGTPTNSNPSVTIAEPGPAPIGVPNFVIDQFSIPPFLLSIYQACGTEYGIPWPVLASINRIETAFGTNLNVSSAGAVGWMQFLPSTWRAYGVDANSDGRKDPYNPVDAICAAARYLKAAGAEDDLPTAIFAYNHADWYVDEVLLYARQYGNLPGDLVGSLTGLTEGAHFPVAAPARYADDISERRALARSKPAKRASGNAADVVSSSPTRRGIDIYSRPRAPVVAVNDGIIRRIGRNERLGKFIVLEDAYGNRFTYAELGRVAQLHPVPRERELDSRDFRLVSPDDSEPKGPASDRATALRDGSDTDEEAKASGRGEDRPAASSDGGPAEPHNTENARQRLYAFPERPQNIGRADLTGQLDDLLQRRFPGYESFKAYFSGVLKFDRETMEMRPLREGSRVVAGTLLGRIAEREKGGEAPHVHFAIRPTGRGAPQIDPKPILDGWKLLESTAIYRAAGKNPFLDGASIGQILLASKDQLTRQVLADPRLEIYSCGRQDIRSGQVDRRVLATLEYLAESGFRPTVTSLKCGHSIYTTSGNVSHHASGNAIDIAQINGIPILGHQGRGSVTEAAVQALLKLQGSMEPAQVISLMDMGGPTFAMSDHADHIHIGFTPPADATLGRGGARISQLLEPEQWERLISRIAEIDNPRVPTSPSRYSIPTRKGKRSERASRAHLGE